MTRPFRQYRKFWHVTLNVTFDLLLENFNIAPANLHNALRALPDFVSILVDDYFDEK